MAKTYRGILIFVVILGIVMGLAGKKFDGYVYTNTEPRSNTECTLTQRVFDDADVLIFTSPVYVYHTTGTMKSFLDHYGYRWMVHRPEKSMFSKQAVCISTAARAGTKSTNKDIADSFFFWGIPKIYKYGVNVRATSYNGISENTLKAIDKKTTALAKKIKAKDGKVKVGIKTKAFFELMRIIQRKSDWNEADTDYWHNKGWDGKKRPWK